MQELATEAWRLRGPHVEHHAGDLAWSAYFAPDVERNSRRRLWLEGERCVAWAWEGVAKRPAEPSGRAARPAAASSVDPMLQSMGSPCVLASERPSHPDDERRSAKPSRVEEPSSLMFLVHPDRAALLEEVLEWADAAETSALEDDAESIQALEEHGYVRCSLDEPFFAHLLHSLDDLAEPRLPPGFSLRHAREEDLERRVAVHRAAWNPSRATNESWRRVMSAYPYRPELDCVVEAPDGTFAASCLVWLDDQTRVGLLEPVGTDPRFSGRGLARAVCLHALRELRRHRGEAALVHARGDAGYPAPKRLYESIGFREYARSPRFRSAA